MTGTQLWFDRWIFLNSGQEWQLPAELLLDFCGAEGVLFTIEWAAIGAGATGSSPTGGLVDFLRSAAATADESRFESLYGTATKFFPTRTSGTQHVAFGTDGLAGTKMPRGYGSVKVVAGTTDFFALRLRIWVALQGVN